MDTNERLNLIKSIDRMTDRTMLIAILERLVLLEEKLDLYKVNPSRESIDRLDYWTNFEWE